MIDSKRITLGKIRKAFDLDEHEAQSLLSALSPGGIFPYEAWQKAYADFWEAPARDGARVFMVGAPQFPEAGELPSSSFPTTIYAQWMVDFFIALTRLIRVQALKKGLDYLLETAYDKSDRPFTTEREKLFLFLQQQDDHIANHARTSGLKNISVSPSHYAFLLALFPDTIVVDKVAAIYHLHSCGYVLRQETKGLSRVMVEQILTRPEPADPLEAGAIVIPSALWEGRTHSAVRDSLRESDYAAPVIAYVLHYWCGLKNKTQIGKLLGPIGGQDDSASLRQAKKLLAEAENLSIRKA